MTTLSFKQALVPTLLFAALGMAHSAASAQASMPAGAKAELKDSSGQIVGSATFTQTTTGVQTMLEVKGLAPGEHGIHFHQNGACAPGPDQGAIVPFGAAGGHFDPMTTRNHGRPEDSAEHVHAGDVPNLVVGADGVGRATLVNEKVTVPAGKRSIMGRTLVIHADKDDYASDPAGNSGARLVCGLIQPASGPMAQIDTRRTLPGSNVFPEGIAFDERNRVAWTGSSAEGHIYRMDVQQDSEAKAELLSMGGSPGREGAFGMKLDRWGKLWVASGPSASVAVVDSNSGQTERVFKTPPSPAALINDLVISQSHIYVTDSFRPVLFRGSSDSKSKGDLEAWIDLTKTPIKYGPGFNLNGIVASNDGRQLISVQSNTGQLWRIDVNTKSVREIKVEGGSLVHGDGLVLEGRNLYVIRNEDNEIARVELDSSWSSGRVADRVTDPRLRYPTTAVKTRSGLLVVNAQTDKQKMPPPVLPFDVVRVEMK